MCDFPLLVTNPRRDDAEAKFALYVLAVAIVLISVALSLMFL
jgi:hypothetical protein